MNPASRLHQLLIEFRNSVGVRTLRESIAQLFSIEDPKSPEVFRAYVSVINLSLEVGERLAAIPNINTALYKRSIENIERHLSTSNIDGDIQSFKGKFKNEDLLGLEFISEQFNNIESEEIIAEEDLKKLEKQLDNLIDQVRKTDVPSDFSHFLISHLFIIRTSVQNYRFFGALGIQSSMAKVIGEILLDPREATTDKKKKGILRNVIDTVKDANALIRFTRSGIEASEALPIDELMKLNG